MLTLVIGRNAISTIILYKLPGGNSQLLIDQIELIKISNADWSFENDSLIDIRAGLLKHNKYQLQQLKQFLRFKRGEYQRASDLYDRTLQQAKKLLTELKEEYDL